MIDHVGISVPSLAEGARFYGQALELLGFPGEPADGGGFVEWDDFAIGEETPERPATRRLHIGFSAESPQVVDAWWQALTPPAIRATAPPGRGPRTGRTTTAPSSSTPPGNSIEAVHNGPRRQPGVIDHLWLRTRSLEAATRFYEAVCPAVDHTVERYDGRTQIRGSGATFSLVEGPPTENLHLAFEAPDRQPWPPFTGRASRPASPRTASPASGPSTTRATSRRFLTDPDGHNIEAVFHDR